MVRSSGYYAWKKQPLSEKVRDNQRLLGNSNKLGWKVAAFMEAPHNPPAAAREAGLFRPVSGCWLERFMLLIHPTTVPVAAMA